MAAVGSRNKQNIDKRQSQYLNVAIGYSRDGNCSLFVTKSQVGWAKGFHEHDPGLDTNAHTGEQNAVRDC